MKKITLLFSFLCALSASAAVTLPDQIGDKMVLQQQADAKIWGWATPGAKISVSGDWSEAPVVADTDKDGRWTAMLPTPAGSFRPHTVIIKGDGSDITLADVLVGEVWIASGQSNMEMPLDGFRGCPIENSNQAIAEAKNYTGRVRMATLPLVGALTPQDRVAGAWKECNIENAPRFSAVGYFFARTLSDLIDMPVGIISAAYGGSRVEGWLPREILETYPDFNIADAENAEVHYYRPMVMYNAMLMPIAGYTARGFLWNQGESNVGRHETYADRLSTMVGEWRRLWGSDTMPFYSVQLPPYQYGDGLYATSGALLREAQQQAMDKTPNCGIVTSIDLQQPGQYLQIHPARKEPIGRRLAWMAAVRDYGIRGLQCESPRLKNVEFMGDKAKVHLLGGEEGVGPWQGLTGFEVAGPDRIFHPAEAINFPGDNTSRPCIVVSSPEVTDIKSVRYCFRNWAEGNVISPRGLPLLPFRTDTWQN